jgi:acyl carrier protein
MMTEQELYGHVTSAIKEVLNIDGRALSPTTSLSRDLGAESIDFLDISCEIEKLVEVEVNFRELARAVRNRSGSPVPDITVRDIVEHLQGAARTVEA